MFLQTSAYQALKIFCTYALVTKRLTLSRFFIREIQQCSMLFKLTFIPQPQMYYLLLFNFILYYPENPYLSQGSQQFLPLQVMYGSVGSKICNALPGLYALSGTNITGSFSTQWNSFEKLNSRILSAFSRSRCSKRCARTHFWKVRSLYFKLLHQI